MPSGHGISAITLWDLDPFDGLRTVRVLQQRRRQLRQIDIRLCRETFHALPIHARRTACWPGPSSRPPAAPSVRTTPCPSDCTNVPPLTPFTSADSIRSVHTAASAPASRGCYGFSASCAAVTGILRCCSCLGRSLYVSTFLPCLPSDRFMLPGPFRARFGPGRCGTMRALTPRRARTRPPRPRCLLCICRPSIPPPTTSMAPGHRFVSHVGSVSVGARWSRLRHSDRRLADTTPPKRVRHPTGCSFASGCSPPRLAATQLPSAS